MKRVILLVAPLLLLLLVSQLLWTGVGIAEDRKYIGEDQCRKCHGEVFEAFEKSFHATVIGKPGGGCEACHGPGSSHIKAAVLAEGEEGPWEIDRLPDSRACTMCHRAAVERHEKTNRTYRENRPACVTCHQVHVDRTDPLFADEGEPPASAAEKAGTASCEKCHGVAVKSARSSVHAPLLAKDGCEGCHGPAKAHVLSGGRPRFVVNPARLQPAEASATCLACHGDAPDHAVNWKGSSLEKKGLTCLTCHPAHGTAEEQGSPAGAALPAATEGLKVVGSAVCSVCHGDVHPKIAESPHSMLMEKTNGCEACHGAGSAHIRNPQNRALMLSPAKLARKDRPGFCLKCHQQETTLHSWSFGAHGQAGLTCTGCHDPLVAKERSSRKTGVDLCYGCHQEIKARFRLPNRHPLDRGAMTCLSCHDPHVQIPRSLDLKTRKQKCFECHRAKSGPFLYEHLADQTEGCVVCHSPHGSVNRRLLTFRSVADLCIQCHVTPPSHSLAPGSVFGNCLNCHGSIHGSYINKNFLR